MRRYNFPEEKLILQIAAIDGNFEPHEYPKGDLIKNIMVHIH